ncbi:retropepsin-like aspartic protease [Galbibacter sp. PAP.153]|uniref:retropepsin-like aspartic protease n=1 Tax=Galbibacter sp. PAP.153 TaxID=3104623 RepID=UPI00300A4CB2
MNKLILILLILISPLTYAQEKPKSQIKIPFTLTQGGHIVISAEVNGIKGNFIFDTGAGINLLTKDFADKITDLEKTDHFYTGHRATGEELQVDLWKSKSLKVEDFKIDNETFAVYDIKFPLDGLISLTPLKNTPFTIDFENKTLNIESDTTLKEIKQQEDFEMPIEISNDREIEINISTQVRLNDKLTLSVRLDSGAGFDVFRFNARFMETLGIDKTAVKSEFKASYFKPESGNTYYYSRLPKMEDKNRNVSIENFKATFIEGLIYEGIMGINWIGKKLTIDIPDKKMFVTK